MFVLFGEKEESGTNALERASVKEKNCCHRSMIRRVAFRSRSSVALPFAMARRFIITKADAKTFEPEVLQAQQAVCVVFHIPQNSACQQFLSTCDALSEQLNVEAGSNWLKVVAIDGDKNRNLASALSVERAKLPTSFFVMHATIVDKVIGNISDSRLETILRKFSEHYHTQLGIDLRGGAATENPMSAAATADLTSGASTTFLQTKIYASLVGADMIQLPQEAPQLEGIKKLLQQTKQKSFDELQHLHHSIGMDVKRLSDEEMEEKYFKNEVFKNAAMLSALEALFLARAFGFLGQVEQKRVLHALSALKREFPQALSDAKIKRVVSLVEVNIIRGKLREKLPKLHSHLASFSTPSEQESESCKQLQEDLAFAEQAARWLEFVDSRKIFADGGSDFPKELVDEMFSTFKANVVRAKKSEHAADRSTDTRILLQAVIQMFPKDPQSSAARSRLSTMMF